MSKTENFKGRRAGFERHPENIHMGGRPKKLVSHINEELAAEGFEPVTVSQLKDCYMQILNLPFDRVKAMATKGDDVPILYSIVAKEMIGKRGLEMLDKLLDRAIGKPQQNVDNRGTVNVKISKDDSEL